jgi:hypothetical protein
MQKSLQQHRRVATKKGKTPVSALDLQSVLCHAYQENQFTGINVRNISVSDLEHSMY